MLKTFLLTLLVGTSNLFHDSVTKAEIDAPIEKRRAKLVISSAEDVGAAHYAVIENLKWRLEKRLPRNSHELVNILAEELRDSLCDEDDYECEAMVYKHAISGKSVINNIDTDLDNPMSLLRTELPDDFDFEVEMAIENSLIILKGIDIAGYESALYNMNKEIQNLKESNTITDEAHRIIGIAAISVGMESAKQWNEIIQDPNHIFYKVPFIENNAKFIRASESQRGLQLFNNTSNTTLTFIGGFGLNNTISSIVTKDLLSGALGGVVSLSSGGRGKGKGKGKNKRSGGVVEGVFNIIRILFATASSAVAGSVIGFFDIIAETASCVSGQV